MGKTGLWTQKYEFYSLDDAVIDIAMGWKVLQIPIFRLIIHLILQQVLP